jgi:hypothetical protein
VFYTAATSCPPAQQKGNPMTDSDADKHTPQVRAALYPLMNNLFFVHHDIIEVCSLWLPRRDRDDEREWLALQLHRETQEIPMYKAYVHAMGYSPNSAIRIPDSLQRYQTLKETDDETEIIVGMNVVAQSVIGTIEHQQLLRFDPVLFAPLVEVLAWEAGNLQRVLAMLRRRDPSHVRELLVRYYDHLMGVTKPELLPLLDPIFALGIFETDVIDQAITRLATIAAALGVEPPDELAGVATARGVIG